MDGPEYNTLLDALNVRLPGATTAALTLELGALLREFCDSTNIWIEQIPVVVTDPTVLEYEVESDEGCLHRLLNVVDGNKTPINAFFQPPDCLRLHYPLNTAQTVVAHFSLVPSGDNMTDAPNWILARYWNGFLDGMLARMMSQIAKPYSSANNARIHAARYAAVMGQAKSEVLSRYNFRGQPWRYPRGFVSGRQRGVPR